MQTAAELSNTFPSNTVSFEQGQGGLTRCIVENDHAKASLYLHGAHVEHYQPANETPVLWMSDQSSFESGKPIRGGIPICWPWFGPHPEDSSQPQHGFARISPWVLRSVLESDDLTMVILGLTENESTKPLVGSTFDARYIVSVGKQLKVELSVTNTGNQSMAGVGCALHSYFQASDIAKLQVTGMEEVRYLDKLSGLEQTQSGPIVFSHETDRVYLDSPESVSLIDRGNSRKILIKSTGSKSTVIWNPWIEKSRRMEDFPDEGFRTMVCIETANALDDVRTIEAGETHVIAQTINTEIFE